MWSTFYREPGEKKTGEAHRSALLSHFYFLDSCLRRCPSNNKSGPPGPLQRSTDNRELRPPDELLTGRGAFGQSIRSDLAGRHHRIDFRHQISNASSRVNI